MRSTNGTTKMGVGSSRIGTTSGGGSRLGEGSSVLRGGSHRGHMKSKILHKSGMASLGSSMNSGYGGQVSSHDNWGHGNSNRCVETECHFNVGLCTAP